MPYLRNMAHNLVRSERNRGIGLLISEVLPELLMRQYPMSPSDIGIVALDVVPSLIILDAAHGSLKGR